MRRVESTNTLERRSEDAASSVTTSVHGRLVTNVQRQEMLRRMLRIRFFEERVKKLKAAGQLPGSVHLSIGQEAQIVGACMALRDDDYITGNHRSHGHPIGKGAALAPLMAELFGKATGVCRGKGGSMHLADFSVGSLGESGIVGGLMPIAVGAGLSAQLRGTDQVCLCFFGDGAANCGPFHESLNLAAVWKVPVVFLCENNGYAVFTSPQQVTAVADIAQRAGAYGMPGTIVDGQDVLAVNEVVSTAVASARAGRGPSLVEAKTYRYHEHAEWGGLNSFASYRSDAEVHAWRARDPVELFSAQMLSTEFRREDLDRLRSEVLAEVEAAVNFAEQSPAPAPDALFEDLYVRCND
jgi:acetoin:2,6-dichlorophenolindophenol oxidoreductase subunit alpha